MNPSKWPSYEPATDGNVYRWIVRAAAAARDVEELRRRREAELARIEHLQQQHGEEGSTGTGP